MDVIGYIRVSTNNQDLQRQRYLINKYCTENGYTLVHIYEDFAISGANLDRKEYQNLLNIKKEDADLIVISELSRFSRNENYLKLLMIFMSYWIKLILYFWINPKTY